MGMERWNGWLLTSDSSDLFTARYRDSEKLRRNNAALGSNSQLVKSCYNSQLNILQSPEYANTWLMRDKVAFRSQNKHRSAPPEQRENSLFTNQFSFVFLFSVIFADGISMTSAWIWAGGKGGRRRGSVLCWLEKIVIGIFCVIVCAAVATRHNCRLLIVENLGWCISARHYVIIINMPVAVCTFS